MSSQNLEEQNSDTDIGSMQKVSQWLKSINLEKYEKKFEVEQYNTMDKIMGLNNTEIKEMIDGMEIKREDAAIIYQILAELNQWKDSFCGRWTNDLNDLITITLNDKRSLKIAMRCASQQIVTGYIAICNMNFFLHYDDYPGIFGQLNKEATLDCGCGVLMWHHQEKYVKWYSVNDKIIEVRRWLHSLGLANYVKRFQELKYDNMELIKSCNKSQIEELTNAIGMKKGSTLKILYSLGLLKKKEERFNPYEMNNTEDFDASKNKVDPRYMHLDFERLGGQCFDQEDFPQSTYWFFQQKMHKLHGAHYENVHIAGDRCDSDWENFPQFLEKQYQEGNIRIDTPWRRIKALWEENKNKDLGEFAGVIKWLGSMNLEKYANKFHEEEYDSMELISGLNESQVDTMIELVGCKGGAAAKIKQRLNVTEPKKRWINLDPIPGDHHHHYKPRMTNELSDSSDDFNPYAEYEPKPNETEKAKPQRKQEEEKKKGTRTSKFMPNGWSLRKKS